MAELCEHYGWDPGFWRRMGWRELCGWLSELRRQRARKHAARSTTSSWKGRDQDPWWQEMDRKRRERRGR